MEDTLPSVGDWGWDASNFFPHLPLWLKSEFKTGSDVVLPVSFTQCKSHNFISSTISFLLQSHIFHKKSSIINFFSQVHFFHNSNILQFHFLDNHVSSAILWIARFNFFHIYFSFKGPFIFVVWLVPNFVPFNVNIAFTVGHLRKDTL